MALYEEGVGICQMLVDGHINMKMHQLTCEELV